MHTAIAWAALAYVYTQLTTHTAPEPQHDTHTRLWLRPQGLILDQGPSRSWPRSPLLPSGGRTPQISPKPRASAPSSYPRLKTGPPPLRMPVSAHFLLFPVLPVLVIRWSLSLPLFPMFMMMCPAWPVG